MRKGRDFCVPFCIFCLNNASWCDILTLVCYNVKRMDSFVERGKDMAVCETCGAKVQDGITLCPECGRPVVKMKTSLGLKGQNGKKPVKTTAYNPADAFGDIYDGNSVGGTDPIKVSKEDLADLKSTTKKQRGKSGVGKFIGNVIKLAIFVAICFGIYTIVKDTIGKVKGPETYQEALNLFKEAVNAKDQEQMEGMIPGYITANKLEAENLIRRLDDTEFTDIKILKATDWTDALVDDFTQQVQLEHGSTAGVRKGVTLRVGLRGKMKNMSGVTVSYMEAEIYLIQIKGAWYVDVERFSALFPE